MNNKLTVYLTGDSDLAESFRQTLAPKYRVANPGEMIESDIIIAFCDNPSFDLGYELGIALEKYSKPVLALARKDGRVDQFVESIEHPMYQFSRYSEMADAGLLIEQKIQKHFPVLDSAVCETDVCAV